MIILGLPCDYCYSPTTAHCGDGMCAWSRCPRCHAFGLPGKNFVQWNKDDYMNPYSLMDLEVAEAQRKLPDWLNEAYGKKVEDGGGEGSREEGR